VPYQLARDETLSDGLRRIAGEQALAAIEVLAVRAPVTDEQIHFARKSTKKLRALLRLVRPALGQQGFAIENATLRDAAGLLAPARGAAALLSVFDRLVARTSDQIAAAAFDDLRRGLAQGADRRPGPVELDAAAALFGSFRERIAAWPLGGDAFKLAGAGLRDGYASARRAMRDAEREPSPERLHAWRKGVKTHWYHVRLFAPAWPALLGVIEQELDTLGELLGEEHDLAELAVRIAPESEQAPASAGPLLVLLQRRREELGHQVFASGARLFAARPGAVMRQFRSLYQLWRLEAPPPPGELIDRSQRAGRDVIADPWLTPPTRPS
jgi:CHAD domain-containing protein